MKPTLYNKGSLFYWRYSVRMYSIANREGEYFTVTIVTDIFC